MTVQTWLGSAFTASLLIGCVGDAPETSETSDDVLGNVDYGNDCAADRKDFLKTVTFYGRVAASSRAFEQCMEQGMRVGVPGPAFSGGTYRQCNGDPFFGQGLDVQLQDALDMARSGNDLHLNCTGGGGNASTSIGTYDRTDAESLSFSVWLAQVVDAPRHGAWPYSQAAGVIWHEASHQHGYSHGADDQASALGACGYAGDPTWDYHVNTMPYILGGCIGAVLDVSAAACGPIDTCGDGKLKLVTGYGSSGCECVSDPGAVGTRSANAFTHVTTAANTSGLMTTLDHPLLNGHPEATVQFTHTYNPAGTMGAYNGHHPVAIYNFGHWVLQNQDGTPMPVGTGFFVRVGRGVLHRSTSANTTGHITRIDHPLANGNPNALLTVSPTPYAGGAGGALDNHPIGVYFDVALQRWTIFNEDLAPMPPSSGFSVEVETQTNHGLHFRHTVTTSNTSAYMTKLASPLLDNRPDARFLVTPDWSAGTVYNSNEYGVWFDGASWWIYNESPAGGGGAAMPIHTGFHIEVLRDEVQRFLTVPEGSYGVDSGIDVQPGDRLVVHGSQRIAPWLGSSTTVGPEGIAGVVDAHFPAPWVSEYSLLGRFPSEGYFPIARDLLRTGPASSQRLTVRTNDLTPGDGHGFFEAQIRALR